MTPQSIAVNNAIDAGLPIVYEDFHLKKKKREREKSAIIIVVTDRRLKELFDCIHLKLLYLSL